MDRNTGTLHTPEKKYRKVQRMVQSAVSKINSMDIKTAFPWCVLRFTFVHLLRSGVKGLYGDIDASLMV